MIFYAGTLFVGALLLFLGEPMIARMLLPLLGGTPAVWNTCLCFFQGMLLLGYLYAHAGARWLGLRGQALLHLGLSMLSLLLLPIRLDDAGAGGAVGAGAWVGAPTRWLLLVLLTRCGVPFLLLSAMAPLLSHWIARRRAADPYRIYGASNLGSLVALLAYPLLVEPLLPLPVQARVWAWGYGLLVLLCAGAAWMAWRAPRAGAPAEARDDAPAALSRGRRARWVGLALVPSSLLLGVTGYLSTDIAAMPLLWVGPLAIYLLTFVVAFSGLRPVLAPHAVRLAPLLALLAGMVLLFGEGQTRLVPLLLLHLVTFFVLALSCHGELARDRPPAPHLTEFYLWLAVGGAAGGLLGAIVAPQVFKNPTEYPLMMFAACLLVTGSWDGSRAGSWPGAAPGAARRPGHLAAGLPVLFGVAAAALLLTPARVRPPGHPAAGFGLLLVLGLPLVLGYVGLERVGRFRLGQALLLCASVLAGELRGATIRSERSFFGVLRVLREKDGEVHRLVHGLTLHGRQDTRPSRRGEPLTYYHREGPAGQIFAALAARAAGPAAREAASVGIIGLGVGTLAAYGLPGQRMTFYELDPLVEAVARDPACFTYLRDSPARIDVVLGDARLRLSRAGDAGYALLVLDAFSSDMIPVHLLTREAMRLYLRKLSADGTLLVHISNHYFDLAPVLGALAREAGLVGRLRRDPEDAAAGKSASDWVVLARRERDLGTVAAEARWVALPRSQGAVWRDDFAPVLGALRRGESAPRQRPGESVP